MSFSGLWMALPLDEPVVARLTAELGPVIERQARSPRARESWRRWVQNPEGVAAAVGADQRGAALTTEGRDFHELSGACPLDEYYELTQDAWAQASDHVPPLVVMCRKGYPVAALAHALGPRRFARLPGWMGDFVLSPQQTRDALPMVEQALAFDDVGRRDAEERAVRWLCNVGDGTGDEAEEMLDGLVPLWRAAADAGMGLFGHMITPY